MTDKSQQVLDFIYRYSKNYPRYSDEQVEKFLMRFGLYLLEQLDDEQLAIFQLDKNPGVREMATKILARRKNDDSKG